MKLFIHVLQLVIIISMISCRSQSPVKNPTDPLIESKGNPALKINFESGIISMFEDSKCNFWMGSKEEGVCKFDGRNYTYYSTENGLPSNFITSISEDLTGIMWFTTGNGICNYDGNSFTAISINKKWKATRDPETQTIKSTGQWNLDFNNMWFRINNNGLLKYSDGNMDYLAFPISKEDTNFVNEIMDKPYFCPYSSLTIYQDKSDKIWVGTFNRGVLEYDGNSFAYHNPNNFGIGTVRSIFQDKAGNHWFGSNGGGLYKYDGNKYINFTEKLGLRSSNPNFDEPGTLSRVWSIEQDNQGNMWFGTADSGLWKYNGREMVNYTMKDGLPSDFVEIIYKDKKGQLWFCSGISSNGVLYTLKGESFEVVNHIQSKK